MSTRYLFEAYASNPHLSETVVHHACVSMGLRSDLEKLLRDLWSGERDLAAYGTDVAADAGHTVPVDASSWEKVLLEIAAARIAFVHSLVRMNNSVNGCGEDASTEPETLLPLCKEACGLAQDARVRMNTLIKYFRTYRQTHGLKLPESDF